jgi:hypothetical protein
MCDRGANGRPYVRVRAARSAHSGRRPCAAGLRDTATHTCWVPLGRDVAGVSSPAGGARSRPSGARDRADRRVASRPPASLRSRLDDASLEIVGEQPRTAMGPARAIQQARERRAPLPELHEPAPRREPRVRVLHPGLRSSLSFSNPKTPGRPGHLPTRTQPLQARQPASPARAPDRRRT